MAYDFTLSPDLPPPPPSRSFFFKPHYRAALCWVVGTCAYVIVVGFNSRRPPSVGTFVMSCLITGAALGTFMWILAGAARRTFKRTTAEANLFFCVGIFAFTVSGMIGQIRTQSAAQAARTETAAALAEARKAG